MAPTKTAKTATTSKSVKKVTPKKIAKVATATKTVKPTKPTKPIKSTKIVNAVKATKPATSIKPTKIAKPKTPNLIYLKKKIKNGIKKHIADNSIGVVLYYKWYCGITKHEGITRLKQHIREKKISGLYFMQIDAGTKDNAHEIEVHFSKKGMANKPHAGGAKKDSKYVYVFKISPTWIDELLNFIENL